MSTANMEPGSEPVELSIEVSELSEYHQAVVLFDHTEERLLDATAELFVDPGNKALLQDLANTAGYVVKKFETCVKSLQAEITDEDEQVANITQLMLGEEEKHLKVFAALVESELWQENASTKDDVEGLIQAIYDNVEGSELIRAAIVGSFESNLEIDLQFLLSNLPEAATEQEVKPEQDASLRRKIGSHVIDVMKITAGVAAGILIAQHFGKK